MSTQGFHQVQKQTQTLVLAPQLRQSLKILQAPALELRKTILDELETNPVLEELPMESISLEGESAESEDEDGSDSREMEFGEDFQILNQLDEDSREHFAQENRGNVYTSEDAERRQHFFDSLTSETSLQEYLIRQAELTDAGPEVIGALEYLVGSLDDRGFLSSSVSDIALMSGHPLVTVQMAHKLLKTFDPAGIGSVDLGECLLTQFALKNRQNSLAAVIVRDHFELLLRRRIPELARKLSTGVNDIQAAFEEIALLDPAPGRKLSEDTNRIVAPDVKVEADGKNWVITLNGDYIPRLRLSNIYKDFIAKGKLSPKEREFIQEKIRSGKFLISSIEQRQQTIERITREILEFQRDFFEAGVSKLRPLTMSQVADRVGVHETTVSRAISNKYIDTPWGIFDFKFFFRPGYEVENGKSVSNTSIKELIVHLIETEDPAKPLSDQALVKVLYERDIKIARRTVAKYREEMGILPTNLRRRYR